MKHPDCKIIACQVANECLGETFEEGCEAPAVLGPAPGDDAPPEKIASDGSSSAYYQLPSGAVEIQDLVEYRNMNFSVGNIFKAAYRMGKKAGNDELYEVRKILWYANRELQRLTQETTA